MEKVNDLADLRRENESEHASLSDRIKSIGLVNKALMIILVAIFGVMLTLLLSINRYSERAYNVRVKTFNSVEMLREITNKNSDWIKQIYKSEIHVNTLRSEDNKTKIEAINKKIGIF